MVASARKTKISNSKIILIIGGLLVLGIFAWAGVIHPYKVHKEKQRFEKVAVELRLLAEDIQKKIGPADEVKQNDSCGRAHLKNARGPLSCNVNTDLIFNKVNVVRANALLTQTSKLFEAPLREGVGFYGPSRAGSALIFEDNPDSLSFQSIYQDMGSKNDLRCTISYSFDRNRTNTELDILNIGFSCGGPALSEYFPLRN